MLNMTTVPKLFTLKLSLSQSTIIIIAPFTTTKKSKIVSRVGIIDRSSSPGFTKILKMANRIAIIIAYHIPPVSIPGIRIMVKKVTNIDEIKFKVAFIISFFTIF
ncbi:hypothetical protein BSYN_07550 [Bacteroides sedimenti]|uniref:Uncharacterized protein n=1 Tax=Bacteroides sedimenti TaxID=2136147 RepID=A0ABM8IET1_9BACE